MNRCHEQVLVSKTKDGLYQAAICRLTRRRHKETKVHSRRWHLISDIGRRQRGKKKKFK